MATLTTFLQIYVTAGQHHKIMGTTENEKIGKGRNDMRTFTEEEVEEMQNAMDRLDELLKYREIGTIDQCRKAMGIVKTMIERDIEPVEMEVLEAYINFENEMVSNNFTVSSLLEARAKEEVRPLVEKVNPDFPHIGKMFYCRCGTAHFQRGARYCCNCGQRLEE